MPIIAYADSIEDVDVIPSGLFIDKLTGIGGIPRGVITEIFGDEGIGKSSVSLQLVAHAQQLGLKCLWADVEWSYTPAYAKSLGVDNAKLGLIRERFAEDVLDSLEEAAESGKWDLIILDSVGGILPRAEAEKDAGGISDVGVELMNGEIAIIDFKSSKEAFSTHFFQIAGYDLQISENGWFDKDGKLLGKLDKPITRHIVVPFGAKVVTPVVSENVLAHRTAFKHAIGLYKVMQSLGAI